MVGSVGVKRACALVNCYVEFGAIPVIITVCGINVAENLEPYAPKIRKCDTGCVYQINDSLWEGSFYPRAADGKRKKFNVYAKTREECEEALAKMIAEKKAEIAAEKAKLKRAPSRRPQ